MTNDSTVKHPTNKNYILPFGFIQSPIIASICLHKSALGTYIATLNKRSDLTVSVYVDDIVISTASSIVNLEEILVAIKKTADRAGFRLNDKKEEGPAVKITAFNIELSKGSVAITAKRLKELKDAFDEATNPHQQKGILGYINSVNENQAKDI